MKAIDKYNVVTANRPRRILQGEETAIRERDQQIQVFLEEDRTVRSILLLSLEDKYCLMVQNLDTSKEIWDRLIFLNERRTAGAQVSLQREFFNLKLKKDEDVREYVARGERLYAEARDAGVAGLNEKTLINTILAGLPRLYHAFVTSFTNMEARLQSVDELLGRLCEEQSLINKYNKSRVEEVSFAESRNKKGRDNRYESSQLNRRNSKSRANKKACYICGDESHFFFKCPKYDPDYKAKRAKSVAQSSMSSSTGPSTSKYEKQTNKPENIMIAEEVNLSCVPAKGSWFLDTGASAHMSYERKDFFEYKPLHTPRVIKFAGDEEGLGIGIGKVRILAKVDNHTKPITLEDVIFVPNMRKKVISLSRATDRGCHGTYRGDWLTVLNSADETILVTKKFNHLYLAEAESEECHSAEVNEDQSNDKLSLWHQRMAHVNDKYLLKTSAVVEGMTIQESNEACTSFNATKCAACCLGKQTRAHAPSRTSERAQEVGQRVHVDISEIGTRSYDGGRYFILFKDEMSNFRFVYVMKSRSEAFENIRKVVAQIAADTKMNVRYVVSDKGSEFTSARTQAYFIEKNIVHVTSAPFTPTQNGFIERDNRTVVEAMRSMLYNKRVDVSL